MSQLELGKLGYFPGSCASLVEDCPCWHFWAALDGLNKFYVPEKAYRWRRGGTHVESCRGWESMHCSSWWIQSWGLSGMCYRAGYISELGRWQKPGLCAGLQPLMPLKLTSYSWLKP